MRRRITSLASAVVLALALLTGPAAAAPPGQADAELRIVGNARLTNWNGVVDGTTVQLDVLARCPVGSGTYLPFAGMPAAFDGQFPTPYLPGMTSPATYGGMVACTGRWERATTIARSVARNQDPSTHPFEYFAHGRTTFVVHLGPGPDPLATTTKTVQVVVPGGNRR